MVSVRSRTGTGGTAILALFVLAALVVCLYKARQFAAAAPSESSTTARSMYRSYNLWRDFRLNYYSCNYVFVVDGDPYSGTSDCPALADGHDSDLTVYYDPSDPSVNSALEFKAASVRSYRDSILMLAFEIVIVLSAIFFALLDANERKPTGAVCVDFHGTVIHPDEIKINPGFGASQRREPESANTGGSEEGPPAADFDFSPRLRELYLGVVNLIHPDRAASEADLVLRERLMKEANVAFQKEDAETLRRIVEEYRAARSDR